MSWTVSAAFLLAAVAIVPWGAVFGPDALLVAFALAPPVLMGVLLGLRMLGLPMPGLRTGSLRA